MDGRQSIGHQDIMQGQGSRQQNCNKQESHFSKERARFKEREKVNGHSRQMCEVKMNSINPCWLLRSRDWRGGAMNRIGFNAVKLHTGAMKGEKPRNIQGEKCWHALRVKFERRNDDQTRHGALASNEYEGLVLSLRMDVS
jgi:hypothetical protein